MAGKLKKPVPSKLFSFQVPKEQTKKPN